ncbi:MAG: hypothetical protein Fur0034_18550 [Desulfuromonadia bacterium]
MSSRGTSSTGGSPGGEPDRHRLPDRPGVRRAVRGDGAGFPDRLPSGAEGEEDKEYDEWLHGILRRFCLPNHITRV